MIQYFLLLFISVSVAFCYNWKRSKILLFLPYLFIFVFSAIRIDYGNDYKSYYEKFLGISSVQFEDLTSYFLSQEPGWLIFNWLFSEFNFSIIILITSLFLCFSYAYLINNFVPKNYHWLAIFIFLANPDLFLINLSAMRQSISISIFLLSVNLILRKKTLLFYLNILFASLFHYSAILLLPFYHFRKQLLYRINLFYALLFFTFFMILLIFGDTVVQFLLSAVASITNKYDYYTDKSSIGSGLGIIVYFNILLLILFFDHKLKSKDRIFTKLFLLSILILPLTLSINMIGRLILYFVPFSVIFYPLMVQTLQNIKQKVFFAFFIILLHFIFLLRFFSSEIYSHYYINYKSLLSFLY